MRAGALVLAAVLGGGLLTGCASEQEQYCDTVSEHQQELTEIATDTGQDAIFRALPIYEDLAAEAPDDIADDWDLVVSRLEALRRAFDDAGVDPATYDPEKPPADLRRADRAAISDAATALVDGETTAAMTSVEQHARDVCKTELGSAPLGG
ncbi:MAG TPA: hypothetical protein VF728_01480 [Nocardioides sp.]